MLRASSPTRYEKRASRWIRFTRIRFARIFTFHWADLDRDEQPRRQWNCIKLRRWMTHWYNLHEAATMAEEASSSKYKRVNGSVCRPSGYLSRFSEIIPRTPWLTVRLVPAGPHECKGRWIIRAGPWGETQAIFYHSEARRHLTRV